MKELILCVFFGLASAQAGPESIPFKFYEELKNSTNEQCRIDVNIMLAGAKILEKWALESRYLFR